MEWHLVLLAAAVVVVLGVWTLCRVGTALSRLEEGQRG